MKFKRFIMMMFVLITGIIISIQDVNASTGKIEVFFTVGGQRELTKSYLDSKSTTHATYGKILMMDINVSSISGSNEGLSTLEFSIEENDIFQGIITTSPQTYERVVPNPDDDFFGYPKWSTNGSSSNNFIAVTEGGDDALIKTSSSKIATVIMRYNSETVEENFEINLTYEVAAYNSGTTIYDISEISLPSIIIGDPNSTPDASLSALNITGTTTSQVYPFDVSATEVAGKVTQNITIDYQDSIGGLTINPVFTKTTLGSSNYVITESKASTNYQTGDVITITTTDGDQSKIYEILLTVTSASSNTGIELKLAQGDLGTITFNSADNRYEIVTPFTENDIKILATTAYPFATLDKQELRITNIEQDVFTHVGDFNVTAENGSSTTNYPVYVKRQKGSSDATIKIITNEYPTGVVPAGNVFTINYPHTKTSLGFQITKNQTGQTIKYKEVGTTTYTNYTTGIITKNSLETGETYSYEVVVTPESQFPDEVITYIVNFVIEPSNDTSIKTGDVKVQETGLSAINLNVTNLVYTVTNNTNEFVTLIIEPGNKREAKIGDGTYQSAQLIHQISVASLNYGTNNFILTIKAQDGTEKEYIIKIEKKSDQAELESILFRTDDGTVIANLDDFTFISSENKYTYSFDYGLFAGANNLKLETKTSAKSIIKGTSMNQLISSLDFGGTYEVIRTVSLEVTSENGAVVKNYTIQITRTAADSNNDISAINIGGLPFTQFQIGDLNVTYNKVIVEPVGGINTLNFEVVLPTTSKATVKVGSTTFTKNESGRYSTNIPFVRGIEQNVTIEVTAQNGDKNTIVIPFVVATNDTTLKSLNIEGTDFVFDPAKLNNTININYSFNSNVTITASPQNVDSKVFIDGLVRTNDTYVKAIGSGTSTFKVWVVSEAGTKGSEYVINIVRAVAKTDNSLESFVLKTNNGEVIDLGFLSSKTNYTITIDDRDELWPLIYSAQVNEQNYAYIGTKGTISLVDQQFNVLSGATSNLTIQVYSEGGVLKTYTISIKRANDIKTFDSVTVSGTGFVTQTFTAAEFISGVLDIGNIAYNIDRLNITFNMVDGSKSTITSNFIGDNQTGIWLFSKTGLIEGQFRVKSQAGNFGEYLKIRVNRQVALSNKNLENLEVHVNGNNILLNFDPTTSTYTLRVDRQVSTVTILATVLSSDRSSVQTPFNLSDASGLNHIYTYTHNLNDPAAQPSNVIDIIIKAEDGTSKTYKVTIWRKNVEIGIENIEIKNGSTVIYTGDILSVPNLGEFDFQTNQLTFIVTPKDRFARVSFNGGTILFADEDGLVTYTHSLVVGANQTITLRIQSDLLSTEYAAEAKSQNYNFTYTRKAASTLAELDSLEIIVGGINLLDGVFDSSIIRYEGEYLRVDRTHMSVQINAVGKEFSTVAGLGIKEIKPGISNSYTITVTSQSGTHSKEYTVYIVSKNDDHEINNIKVNSNDIGFIDSEFEYTLDNVLYTVSSLPIQVILNDTFASYYVNGVKNATSIPLVYGNNIIEVYGESEYGTKSANTYRLNIYRNEPYKDTDISSLSITNISNSQNITYKADGTNYLVELPDTSSISNVKVDIELKNTDKQVLESTFNLSNIVLSYNGEGGLDQTITFKVNAEDNSTKTYQIRFVKNIVLSSDNSLSNVSIKNQDNQVVTFPFDELLANNSVVLNLPYSQKSLNIEITPTHNKAQVTPNKLNNISLVVGENTFVFSITAEDGTVSDPYTITVHRQAASKDINLNNLTVTDPLNSGLYLLGLDTLSPKGMTFNPLTKTYTIKLDETYINEEIIINIVKGHIAQTITGPVNAPLTLNHGTNRFEIFIKAEDETVTQGKYTIIIEVLYKSNSLQSLTVDGKALTVQDVNYFDTEKESVTITPVLTHPTHGSYVIKDSLGNVVTNTPSLNFDENVFTIEIKNEYGEIVKTHTLEITRLKSSEKTLSNVSLIGSNGTNYITFDPQTLTYNVEVPQNVEHVTLGATIPAKATITGLGKYTINLDETITITFKVTAEDGSESENYTINVRRLNPSKDINLNNLTVTDPLNSGLYLLGLDTLSPKGMTFNPLTKTYTIKLDETYINEEIIINIVKGHIAQTITGPVNAPLTLNHGTNRFEIFIKAEDETVTQGKYTIIIEVLYKSNSLQSLTVDGKALTVQDVNYFETEKESVTITPVLKHPTHGSYVIKDSLGNVVTNTPSLNFDENVFTIEIKNEYGEIVKTHTLEITRLKSSEKTLSNVSLIGSNGTNYITFDPQTLTYNVEVPQNVEHVTLGATIPAKATITGLGKYTINLDETITITFKVTAEDGSESEIYTIIVTRRALSTNNHLEEISIIDTLDPTNYLIGLSSKNPDIVFDKTTNNYVINLGLEYLDIKYRNLIIRYVKSDTYQTVDKTNPSTLTLNKGTNVFVVTVLAEDSINTQPFIYTITINVLNKENDLKTLTINGDVQDTSSNEIHYTTEEEQANILSEGLFNDGSIIMKDKDGKLITSPFNLTMGENRVLVEVLNAYQEVVEVYEVIITRLPSSDNEFTATLTGTSGAQLLNFDKDINTYHVNVDYLTTDVTLTIVKNAKAISFGEGIYTLVSGETKEITFYVEAENGDVSPVYTVYVTRLFNTEDKLANLTITTNLEDLLTTATFNPETNLYQFSLNEYHTNVTFSYVANYGQTLSGVVFDVAQPLTHGLNVFEIEVQPEDLTLEAFIIRVEITIINSEIDLQNLFIDGVDRLLPGESIIRLEDVSSDKKTLDIEAVLTDLYGTVKINENLSEHFIVDILPGENTIKIDVTSEDGSTTKTYTVLVKQLLDDLDTLDNILVKTQDNLYLLGDASVNPETLFDASTNTYKFVVNETVEHIVIDVVKSSTKQTVTGDLLTPLNIKHGINRFEISVQPEDLTKPARTYLIEVEKVNNEILIDQLLVDQIDIYEEGVLDYVMDTVTNDQKSIKVIPIISNFGTYAIYDTHGNLVQDHDVNLSFGQNIIRIVFTSESGKTTKTITLTIEQTYSSDNQIIDVRFFDASTNINRLNFDPEITTYDLEFPASTTIARLRVETHNKALVFINGVQEINTRKDFNLVSGNTITVKFYVVAENGDKGIEYTINVYKRKATDPVLSDNTNLLDVTIEIPINELKFDFDPTIYEYNIQLPYGHDEMYIKGHTESKGATVFGEGAYALVPGVMKVIRLRVTAEDGTVAEKEYKFNITRALPNTDTTLKTLHIEDLNGNVLAFDQAVFNPENRTYNITLDDDMKLNTVNVLAQKNHETQTLYNTGIIQLHGEVEGYYNTIITVTVVAEDGSVGEYIIYVLHDLDFASLAEVKDISILGDDGISYFGLEFKNNIYVYENILVPFNVDTTRLIVQTIGNVIYLDANNVEIEDNRLQSFGVGSQIVYRFRIESTNGSNTSEVYTIYVNRQLPDTNSLLESLEINGEMVRGFNPNIFEYTIVHPLQFENYLDIYGVAQSDNSTVKGNDVYTLIEGQTRTITIEVKAQSGDVTSYKLHISYVNSNALLGELTVYEMIGEHDIQNTIPLLDDTLEYTIIIGKHTRYVNIKGFAKDQGGASIRGFGIREIGSEDTVVHITVTSGDGLEELTYVLTLRRDTSLSDLKEITLLQINNEEVITSDENDPFVYKYTLSSGTQTVKLNAVANNSSKVSINGSDYSTNNMGEIILTDIQESQVIKISVQAEDGSIQHYMVIIERVQQPSLLLTILLILSIILWVIAAMTYILKRIRKNNKKDKNQLIF